MLLAALLLVVGMLLLVGGGEEICHYFLDEPQLEGYLGRAR